jgi:hypothetical protein
MMVSDPVSSMLIHPSSYIADLLEAVLYCKRMLKNRPMCTEDSVVGENKKSRKESRKKTVDGEGFYAGCYAHPHVVENLMSVFHSYEENDAEVNDYLVRFLFKFGTASEEANAPFFYDVSAGQDV